MTVKFDFKTLGQPFEANWPVTVQVPQDGGTTQEQTFEVRFRLLTPEQEAQTEGKLDAMDARLRLALVDVVGEAFDDALLDSLLSTPYVTIGLIRAYGSFASGIAVKN